MDKALAGTLSYSPEHDLYLIRDNAVVLYIGITTQHITDRLFRHIDNGSLIGLAILLNTPESNRWSVDLLSPVDVVPGLDTATAEKYLIRSRRPLFNGTYNPDDNCGSDLYRHYLRRGSLFQNNVAGRVGL